MSAATAVPAPLVNAAPVAQRPHLNSALYVGDLSPEVTEAILYDIFSAVGPVASIRVCRDAVTRRSLGYAYVNFQSAADAERALNTHNYTPILGRACRIMWCQRDPVLRRSGTGNLFINGLEKSIDHKELHDAFSIFGDILSCKIMYDETGASTGRGFVHFETAQSAEAAIAQCNGTLLREKKITVAHFKSKKERLEESARTEHQFKNVYVKNLPDEFTDDDLTKLFSKYGTITSSVVMRGKDGDSIKSRGFGFVNFGEIAEAKEAVEQINGTEVNGKTVFAGRAMKKTERRVLLQRDHEKRRHDMQERSKGVNLFVKNLVENVDDAQFRQLFEEFGAVTSSRVMRDERGNSKGFGFVCFADQSDATRAVSEMNGRLTEGKPLYVALAQPKEERRQQLATQHRQRVFAQRGAGPAAQPFVAAQGMYPPQMMFPSPYQGPRGGYPQPAYGRFPQGMARVPYGVPQQAYMQPQFGNRGPQPPRQNRPGTFRGPNVPGQPGQPGQQGPGPRTPRQQQPNTRYNAAARNAPVPAAEAPAAQPTNMQQLASLLASAEPERQKQILGDNLYQIISGFYPQQAGKLTGMLLQMDNSDLLHLIEDSAALRAEVDKANEVLLQHSQAAGQAPAGEAQ